MGSDNYPDNYEQSSRSQDVLPERGVMCSGLEFDNREEFPDSFTRLVLLHRASAIAYGTYRP